MSNSKAPSATQPPSPSEGWSQSLVKLRQPVIVPPTHRDFVQPTGVLHQDGQYCAHGALWRKHRPLTTCPDMPTEPVHNLRGRWLWGGVMWGHFGHFVVESTGRLWALDQLPDDISGVIFVPKNPDYSTQLKPFQHAFLKCAHVPGRIKVFSKPVQPQVLFVPGQGFGLGNIVRGTPQVKAFFHNRFARDIAPDGPDKLYISRSGLGQNRAKLLCETHLDTYLADQGYEVFHPQRHDLATQIARYKAARHVIASEGSAIHMFSMVAQPDQKLAIMVRRQSIATDYIAAHYQGFTGNAPLVVNHIRNGWLPSDRSAKRHQVSELDFAETQATLAEHGFVTRGAQWVQPSPAQVHASLQEVWGVGATFRKLRADSPQT